jgi:hypothetical protein
VRGGVGRWLSVDDETDDGKSIEAPNHSSRPHKFAPDDGTLGYTSKRFPMP